MVSSIEGREAVVEAGEEMGEFDASEEEEEGTEESMPPVVDEEMNAGGSGSLKRMLSNGSGLALSSSPIPKWGEINKDERSETHVEAYPSGLSTSLKNAQPITSACTSQENQVSLYARV